MRVLRASILAACVAFATLLSACGGDDDSGPTPTPPPGGQTPAPTAGPDSGRLAELSAMFLGGVDGKYVYLYYGSLGQFTEIELRLYWKDVNDRHDWAVVKSDFPAETITIIAGPEFYLCTRATGFAACQKSFLDEVNSLRSQEAGAMDVPVALVREEESFEISELPSVTVAGKTGECFHATRPTRIGLGPPASEDVEICYSAAGELLSLRRTVKPDNGAEDLHYNLDLQQAGEALDSDFEPIAPVQ